MAPHEPGTADAGLIVTGGPMVQRLRRMLIADGVNIRPCGGGRLMIWSGQIDTEVQESERASRTWCQRPAELAAAAMQAAQLYLPALASAEIETARICRRALPRDGLPAMGWLPGGRRPVCDSRARSGHARASPRRTRRYRGFADGRSGRVGRL